MATALKKRLISLQRKVARFAEQNIACRDDLHSMNGFPHDIWDKMGKENLMGISIPAKYGGLGEDYLSIVVAGETLMLKGHNMGITMSWLTHQAVSRFLIRDFGDKTQHETYLNRLARGEITASIAVSEPGRGAHPGHIKTTGYRQGDLYFLDGEKSYLTNGPLADLFIVVAATGVDEGQKRFTAFLVPNDAPGLSLTEPMDLDFFRPAPHGGIILSHCSIPASNILGKEGSAYNDMVKPFRELEDTLMMGPLVGGMERQFELILGLIEKNGVNQTDELREDLGELQSIIDTLRIMAYEATRMLDSSTRHPEFVSLLITFRKLSKQYQDIVELSINKTGIPKDHDLHLVSNDLIHGLGMGQKIALIRQKKLGEKLLWRKGSDEDTLR